MTRKKKGYSAQNSPAARQAREVELLNAITAEISQSSDLAGILNHSLQRALGLLEIDRGGIYLLDESSGLLKVAAYCGLPAEFVEQIDGLQPGEGFSGHVAQTGEPLVVSNLAGDPRLTRMAVAEAGLRSVAIVPVRSKGKILGTLFAITSGYREFQPMEVDLLTSVGSQIGMAVENIRFHERAQHLAVMEERSRLARELHDAVTQTLFSASLIAEAVPTVWEKDPQKGRDLLQELRSLSRGALAEMRTLLLELRPAALVETPLEDLLRQLGEAASGREGIPVKVLVEGTGTLPSEVHVALYRIAQEALNNVVKHARASQVIIRLCYTCGDQAEERQGQSVLLSLMDDGRGFDLAQVPHHRLGLRIMQERADAIGANLFIDSQPGEGTQVTVIWEQVDTWRKV